MSPSEIVVDQALRDASRMGAKPIRFPATADHAKGDGTPCVKYINGEYHLTCEERGKVYSEFTSTSADEIRYRLASITAKDQAVLQLSPAVLLEFPRGQMKQKCEILQLELLARVSPEWAERRRLELYRGGSTHLSRLAPDEDPPRATTSMPPP